MFLVYMMEVIGLVLLGYLVNLGCLLTNNIIFIFKYSKMVNVSEYADDFYTYGDTNIKIKSNHNMRALNLTIKALGNLPKIILNRMSKEKVMIVIDKYSFEDKSTLATYRVCYNNKSISQTIIEIKPYIIKKVFINGLYHEIGHMVDHRSQTSLDFVFKSNSDEKFSNYAKEVENYVVRKRGKYCLTNMSEMFAEIFALWLNKDLAKVYPAIYNYICTEYVLDL